jgi:hypothetical protein
MLEEIDNRHGLDQNDDIARLARIIHEPSRQGFADPV